MESIFFQNISRCYCSMIHCLALLRLPRGMSTVQCDVLAGSEKWSTGRQYVLQSPCFSDLSGEAVLENLDATWLWIPYNSFLLFRGKGGDILHSHIYLMWISFVLFCRMHFIFAKYQNDTPSYLYFWTVFFKGTENSQIWKTECKWLLSTR